MATSPPRARRTLVEFLQAVFSMSALWLILVDGELRSLALAALFVGGAACVRVWLGLPRTRIRLAGLAHFVPFFVWTSVVGAIDVVLRALGVRPLAPGWLEFRLRLEPSTPAGVFFITLVSLLPGTLAAAIHETSLTVHVVDQHKANAQVLRRLEHLVSALFGTALVPEEDAR